MLTNEDLHAFLNGEPVPPEKAEEITAQRADPNSILNALVRGMSDAVQRLNSVCPLPPTAAASTEPAGEQETGCDRPTYSDETVRRSLTTGRPTKSLALERTFDAMLGAVIETTSEEAIPLAALVEAACDVWPDARNVRDPAKVFPTVERSREFWLGLAQAERRRRRNWVETEKVAAGIARECITSYLSACLRRPAGGKTPAEVLAQDNVWVELKAINPLRADVYALKEYVGLSSQDIAGLCGLSLEEVRAEYLLASRNKV